MDYVLKDHSGCTENGLQDTGEEVGRSGKGACSINFQLNMVDWILTFTFVPSYNFTKMTEKGQKGMNSDRKKKPMEWR